MATEPPRPAEEAEAQPPLGAAPGPAAAAVEGGGRRRGLNGCVPLSHQVAGHMYGKDKGGERRPAGPGGGGGGPGEGAGGVV